MSKKLRLLLLFMVAQWKGSEVVNGTLSNFIICNCVHLFFFHVNVADVTMVCMMDYWNGGLPFTYEWNIFLTN